MTSIVTNNGAMVALATLRDVNQSLSNTQSQVSSGLKISKASDDAAYWSISTTMKSDVGALSAVSDALGLGAAKADTAYEGLNSTIDVLDQIKDKLVTAKEGSVDRTKIQTEIDQFKQQLTSIAESASFNGENWLNTSIADIQSSGQATTTVVSSFVRSGSDVAVNTTSVGLWGISLFNSTGDGILQADDRSPGTIGGLRDISVRTSGSVASTAAGSNGYFTFSTPLVFTDDSTAITFDMTVDADDPTYFSDHGNISNPGPGTTVSVTLNRSAIDAINPSLHGTISNRDQLMTVLQKITGPLGGSVSRLSNSPTDWAIISNETSGNNGASIQISNVQSTLADGGTGGLSDTDMHYGGVAGGIISQFDQAFKVSETTKLYIPVQVDGTKTTLTVDRVMVDSVLGTTTGEITSASDLVAVLQNAMTQSGSGAWCELFGPNTIDYGADTTVIPKNGGKTSISVGPASDNFGPLPDFNILDLDVTSSNANIDNYLFGLEGMLKKATVAASTVGSLQSRIGLQTSFSQSLSDSLKTGVGKLVDADMEEASAKLAADQTQQQLAIQSLSISNASSQNLLQLFR